MSQSTLSQGRALFSRTRIFLVAFIFVSLLTGALAFLPSSSFFGGPSSAAATELFISEYIEGSSNNKAIEIYNGTGSAINLSTSGYNLQMFFNGSASAGLTISLTGTVAAGDVYVIANASANATILAQADQTDGAGWFNGDDAVVLRKGTTVIDSIGQVGFDPGTEWGTGLTSTADNTLRKKTANCLGDTNTADVFDPATAWDGFAIDTFGGLGAHSATCGDTPTNPSGTGAASPAAVFPSQSSLLTVTVTPGTNPTSTGLGVTADLSSIGGSVTQQFFDNGTNGDTTVGDNIFSFSATVAGGTTPGLKSLPASITDGQARSGNTNISLQVQEIVTTTVRISQVYGGGGNNGAPLRNDYIELFNSGSSPVNVTGWSVQYISATGTTTWSVTPLSGSIAPGGYYLVQQATNDPTVGAPLPTPDSTGTIAMAAGAGKVGLRTTSVPATGVCPTGWADLVGYGGTANCSEGLAPAPAPSATLADFRKRGGCVDTNVNAPDFSTGAPAPRNSASPANSCTYVPTTIHAIQGPGMTSPFNNQLVSTTGIVTAKKSNGFFLQEPDVSPDPAPGASKGIFVFTGAAPAVAVGDAISVQGGATEFSDLTEIEASIAGDIQVNTNGNPLPAPIVLDNIILSPTGSFSDRERYECMRVSAASMTSVTSTNEFGEIWAVLAGVDRPFREPGIEAGLPIPPDPTSGVPDVAIPIWDKNPERIMIDSDGVVGSTRVEVTSKVALNNIIGPLDFTFNDYKIATETTPVVASPNMTAVPVPAAVGTQFSVAGFNIENYAGATTQTAKAALGIRTVMNLPDVIGTIEISSEANLQLLANRVNADVVAAGGTNPNYQAHLIQAPAGGSQNVGFLVKESRVQVNSVTQEQGTRTFIDPTDGSTDFLHDRPPLVLHATVNAPADPRQIIVVVNHLRSFIDIELVAGAGIRVREKRKLQSEATAELLQQLQTDNPGVPVISVGDYNAYQFNDGFTDPIATLKGTPTADENMVVDASPDIVEPNFTNLIDTLPATEQYSFVFEGTPQALDHVLVNSVANSIVQSFAVARMNSDFNESLNGGNPASPLNNSDHDSPVAIFQFPKRETTTTVSDVTVTYNTAGQNINLNATVTASPNTVDEGTVTFTVKTLDGTTTIATVGPVAVDDGAASGSFFLPGSVLPQQLVITAEFSGGDTTLASTDTGTLTIKYAICAQYDPMRAVKSGATYPIKIRLCDVNGVNVSSPSIQVHAVSINLISAPDTSLEVQDAGNANADNNFRYDATIAGYIFNLKTTGLAPGVYQLNFTAGDDPTVHSTEFRVK